MPLPPALPSANPPYPAQSFLKGQVFQKWTPQFFNQSSIAASGASIDLGLAATPLHLFELNYEFLRDTRTLSGNTLGPDLSELTTLMGFFLTMRGTLGRFAYQNPADKLAIGAPFAVGDSATNIFTMTRTIQSGYTVNAATEPIGFFDPLVNVNVYDNAVLVAPSQYSLTNNQPANQQITFFYIPVAGHILTIDMGYYYYCRFAENIETFEQFTNIHWMATTVKLQSCRKGA
jgi:hypothetical protein